MPDQSKASLGSLLSTLIARRTIVPNFPWLSQKSLHPLARHSCAAPAPTTHFPSAFRDGWAQNVRFKGTITHQVVTWGKRHRQDIVLA